MSRKERMIGFGLLALSVGLFYLAIDAWACGEGRCKSQVAKALDIIVPTDTSDGWSGAANPTFRVTAPRERVTYSPPPTYTGDDGDDGGDGH